MAGIVRLENIRAVEAELARVEIRIGFRLVFARNFQFAGSSEAGYELLTCHNHVISSALLESDSSTPMTGAPGDGCEVVGYARWKGWVLNQHSPKVIPMAIAIFM